MLSRHCLLAGGAGYQQGLQAQLLRTFHGSFPQVLHPRPGAVHESVPQPLHPGVCVGGYGQPCVAVVQRQGGVQHMQLQPQLPAPQGEGLLDWGRVS